MLSNVVILDIDKYHKILDESQENTKELANHKLLIISLFERFVEKGNIDELHQVFTDLNYKVIINHKGQQSVVGKGHKQFKIEI